MDSEIDWLRSGLPDQIYKDLLGNPYETSPDKHAKLQQQFRASATRLLNRELGRNRETRRDKILRTAFEQIANAVFEYICGSNLLTENTLFERAKDQITCFADKRDKIHKASPESKETDRSIIEGLIIQSRLAARRFG